MEKLYRMNEAAELLGVSIRTLQRWDKTGKINIVRTPNGRRRIPESELKNIIGTETVDSTPRALAIYARVSSHDQKKKGDLKRQVDIILEKMSQTGFDDTIVIEDVGSGLNDKRKGLIRLMALAKDGKITDLAIRYRDRLTRFGYEYLHQYFESHHVTIHVLDDRTDEKSVQEELVDDLMAIIASFSGRLYGIRSHKNHLLLTKVKGVIEDVTNLPNETKEHRTE